MIIVTICWIFRKVPVVPLMGREQQLDQVELFMVCPLNGFRYHLWYSVPYGGG